MDNLVCINEIKISNAGYIRCKSSFYELDVLLPTDSYQYVFKKGKNIINCEIDSPEVAISYLLSMRIKNKKNILFCEKSAYVNNQKISLNRILKYSCYIDEINPFFSKKHTVRHLISKGIKNSKMQLTVEQIAEMFKLTDRIDKPIKATGNEKYQAMVAIAFAYGKQIFCFPWFSKKRTEYYAERIRYLLNVLDEYKKIVIIPKTGDGGVS